MEKSFVDSWLSDAVYGSAETVRAELDPLHARTEADELIAKAYRLF